MGILLGLLMWMMLLMTIVFCGAFAYQGVMQAEPAAAAIGFLGLLVFLSFAAMGSQS